VQIPTDDLYAMLGVSPDADTATIHRAYRSRMRQSHPDLQPEHQRAHAHERAVKLNTAWSFLSDPVRRRDYDTSRRRTVPPPQPPPRRQPPPPPRPPPAPPPPPPPRKIVLIPEAIDFGTVRAGTSITPQTVWISFRGGSLVHDVQLSPTAGRFWHATVIRAEDERSVRIQLTGPVLPVTTGPGRLADWLRVQIDEVTVEIPLSVTVEAAPQRPAPPPPWPPAPPARPTPTPPRPKPGYTARPSSRSTARRFSRLVTVLLVLLLAVVVVGRLTGHLGGNMPQVASDYCSISSYDGQMLSFYQTKPGTTQQANDTVAWSIMVPGPGDELIDWWTPQFPYWDEMNQADDFEVDGQTYGRFQYVEVLPVWQDPWEPLSAVFTNHPHLVGGPTAEAAERRMFITKWSKELSSPQCA
jgi:DnaJ domain